MDKEKLIEQLREGGNRVEDRGDILIINGVPTPIMTGEEQPFRDDCVNGNCAF